MDSTDQQSNLRCVAHFSQSATILKSGDTGLTLN